MRGGSRKRNLLMRNGLAKENRGSEFCLRVKTGTFEVCLQELRMSQFLPVPPGTARRIVFAAPGTRCSGWERARSPGDRENEPEGSRDGVGRAPRGEQAGVRGVDGRQQLSQSLAD